MDLGREWTGENVGEDKDHRVSAIRLQPGLTLGEQVHGRN